GVSGCGNAKCTLCVDWYSFDDVVLMQYTGLKDKNGKKIFEGDVVTAFSNINKYTDSFAGDVEPTFCFTSIVYDGACFKTTYKGEPSYVLNQNGSSLVKHMEVIGNIHENPELLEGTE
ncbi:TPA: YopX family protein, partial [Listeria monocytogenes]